MTDTYRPLQLLGLSGSLRRGSNTTALLNALRPLLPEGVNFQIMTLHAVPLYDGDLEDQGIPVGVVALKEAIEAADAVIVASPEYNFSIPGVLKNALDWTSRPPGQSSWRNKPVLPLTSSPGPWGGVRAQASLREGLSNLGARNVPSPHLAVAQVNQKLAADGTVSDEALSKTLSAALQGFIAFARSA